jgi:hypothetical protein
MDSMNKLFNTEFEVSLRLLLILDKVDKINEDEIARIDFFAIFANQYGFGESNLNGVCAFPLNEFTIQHKLIKYALRELLFRGFAIVHDHPIKGFIYSITDLGKAYVSQMNDNYSLEYKRYLTNIINILNPLTINKLKEITEGEKI